MIKFIFGILFMLSIHAQAGVFLKEVNFLGKKVNTEKLNWKYYRPTDLFKGKIGVLENKNVKGLLGYKSEEIVFDEKAEGIKASFKKVCEKSIKVKGIPFQTKLIPIGKKTYCRKEFSRGNETTVQFLAPKILNKKLKKTYKIEILTFSYKSGNEPAKKTISKFMKRFL